MIARVALHLTTLRWRCLVPRLSDVLPMVFTTALLMIHTSRVRADSELTWQATPLSDRPTIDGRLDDPAWRGATPYRDFVQYEPQEGAPVSEATEARIGFTHEALYISVRCDDREPDAIQVYTLRRDDGQEFTFDDSVEVVLDTFRDGRTGYGFMCNPAGAQIDFLIRNEGEERNFSWDGAWQCVATRDAGGWSVELAIPFKILRFNRDEAQRWGFNLKRRIARKQEQSFLSPVSHAFGETASYKVSQFGTMIGLEGLNRGHNLQVRPHVLGGIASGPTTSLDPTASVGLDGRYSPTSNVLLDLTFRTDFAEVEADLLQLNLTPYKLYYPEKREFFLENANLFFVGERIEPHRASDTILFFSRRVGLSEDGSDVIPVLGGARLTGRLGPVNLGGFYVTTGEPLLSLAGDDASPEPLTHQGVTRLSYDVLPGATLGVLATGRFADNDDYNLVGAADWQLHAGDFQSKGFVARSSTPGQSGKDLAFNADLLRDTERSRIRLAYTDIGANFNPELGFLARTDIRKAQGHFRLKYRSERILQSWYFYDIDYITNHQNDIRNVTHGLRTYIALARGPHFALKFNDVTDVLDRDFPLVPGIVVPAGQYRTRDGFLGYLSNPNRPVIAFTSLAAGELYDGLYATATAKLILRPIVGTWIENEYNYTAAQTPHGDFQVHLINSNLGFALSPNLETRLTVRWRSETSFAGSALLHWRHRNTLDLYLIYDEDWRWQTSAEAVLERRVMAKLSYLFSL